MKCDKQIMLLYAVTDRSWIGKRSLYQQVEEAIKGGVTCVQLREKNMEYADFLREAESICSLCRQYSVPFIVNDNPDIAVACDADGIHVGQEDLNVKEVRQRIGNDMILGVSVHNVKEAQDAVESSADYLGLGAIFPTNTKNRASVMSMETLQNICCAVEIPVVAIGGINERNIERLSGTGIDGVAMVSAIFSATDIENTCRKLRKLSEKVVRA